MSHPTELPDLDRLEALAKAVKKGRDAADWEFAKAITPGTVLAILAALRAALARRAQPESEAPQAEPVAYLRWWARQIDEGHGNIGHEEGFEVCEPNELSDDGSPAFAVYDRMPRVVVPAAQQAESGAQAPNPEFDKACGAFYCENKRLPNPVELYEMGKRAAIAAQSQGTQPTGEFRTCCDNPDCSTCAGRGGYYRLAAKAEAPTHCDPAEGFCAACREQERAQQAAAPGAEPGPWQVLTDNTEINGARRLDVVLTNGVQEDRRWYNEIDWTQVADWRYSVKPAPDPSAPGTPEAPKGGA